MGTHVVFLRPVEKVGVVYDLLAEFDHYYFPIIDTHDNNIVYGAIGRNDVSVLLRNRAFGHPVPDEDILKSSSDHIEVKPDNDRYIPLVQYQELRKAYPRNLNVDDIRIDESDRECYIDLRPYADKAPYTILENSSIETTYNLFRTLGATFLIVVNKYNQCVGTITRHDLTPESLAQHMLTKGRHV